MSDLEKSVLSTIAYYDVLSRPLTSWEVFKLLVSRSKDYRLSDVVVCLNGLSCVSKKNGFYFLRGRDELIEERIKRQKSSAKKWKKACRLTKFLQAVPFVRLVAVSGSLAQNNAHENSDIDLLIAARSGRIWTCRFLFSFLTQIMGQRRYGDLIKDRFCLNHYFAESDMHFPFESLYNAQTYVHLTSLYGHAVLRDFQRSNRWLEKYLVSYPVTRRKFLYKIKCSLTADILKKVLEFVLSGMLGNILEARLKKYQKKRVMSDPLTYQSGGRVILNDSQLEFHTMSPEKNILSLYNQKMMDLGLIELANEKDSGLTI